MSDIRNERAEQGGVTMDKNREKLNAAIGKTLDRLIESLDKKEAPEFEILEALRVLTGMTSLTCLAD